MLNCPEYKGFIFIFIFFTAFYFILSSGHFDSVDEVHVFQTTQSLIKKGELTVPPVVGAVKGIGEKYFSPKSILPSILLIPFYLTGSFLNYSLSENTKSLFSNPIYSGDYNSLFGGNVIIHVTAMFNVAATALLCALYYLFSIRLRFSQKTSFFGSFILGVSTILCYYSKTLFTHTLGCLFLFAAVYFLIIYKEHFKQLPLVLSGLSLSFAVLTRFELALAIPVYLWYIAADKTPFQFRALNKELINKYILFLLPVFIAFISRCFINHSKFGLFTFIGYSDISNFHGSMLEGLYGNLISVGRSVFIYSPPLVIAMFYFKDFLKENKNEAVFSIAVSLLFVFYYSKLVDWQGGMCWGNRYLLILIPFLLFPLNYLMESYFKNKIKWPFYFMLLFVFAGLWVQIIGMTPLFAYVFSKYDLSSPGLNGITNNYLFIPDRSQIARHWETILRGEFTDYWLYHIFKTHGFSWLIFFAGIPLAAMGLAVNGIFKIISNHSKNPDDKV